MKKKLEFNILTTASPEVGLGHLKRCLLLAKEIKKKNKLNFYLFSKKKFLKKIVKIIDINIILNPRKIKKSNITIVDMYKYNDNFYKKIYKNNSIILIFDDNKYSIPNYVSGVINPNLYSDISKYDYGTKIFSGKKYMLIDKAFILKKNIKHNKEINNIFICVGGSDPTKQMDNLISIALNKTKRNIYAVFGHLHNRTIKKKWIDEKRVKVLVGTNNIRKYMTNSKFAISSAGTLLNELYYLKTPTLFISLDKNQDDLARYYSNKNGYSFVGNLKNLNLRKLTKTVEIFNKKKFNLNKNNNDLNYNGPKKLLKDISIWVKSINNIDTNVYNKELIKEEYDESSLKKNEYEKLHWGSKKSMINRYKLISKEVDFNYYSKWLDIGSGTGSFQIFINKKFPKSKFLGTGIEISKKLYEISKTKKIKNIKFKNIDFNKSNERNFDLITCFGVLSKTNISFKNFLKMNINLLKKNGEIIFDIKNLGWDKFTKKKKFPDPRHSWFKLNQVISSIKKNNSLKIIKIFGFLPGLNQKVLPNKSHNVFIRIKKII